MELQGLQLSPEMIDGDNRVEEVERRTEEGETEMDTVDAEEDEEFYERIEAPKFVDFTKPNPFRPDDRYWFCSRVGCDQKHEEEIDPEEISKNFVLRVLAARSPNIKLRKALNGKHSSIKCPLSAPAKPSKSRIPRLAVFSSISHKMVDPESKIKPPSKVNSTPMVKSRQVAAKYMTTQRNKRCLPNSNSFRSVQNQKPTAINVPKNLKVAKALVFHSPKKAISLKKSVELYTPLTKICEGMKRLDITTQKKSSKDLISISNPKKPASEDSSRRHLKLCKGEKRADPMSPKSTNTRSKKTLTHKCRSLHEQVAKNEPSYMDNAKTMGGSTLEISRVDGGNGYEEECHPSDATEKEATMSLARENSHSQPLREEKLPNIEDKENVESAENHSSEVLDTDDKENALTSEDNNRELGNHQLGKKNLGKDTIQKNKVGRTPDKKLKSGITDIGVGATMVKYRKPKPTNVKPFRLRTDERGILKEAILERKLHLPTERETAKDTSGIIKRTRHIQRSEMPSNELNKPNNATIDTSRKETDRVIPKGQMGSKLVSNTQQRRLESTHRRPTTSMTRSPYPQRQYQVAQLGVIKERSSKVTKQHNNVNVNEVENKTRAASASRSTSRGKRHVTIAKEPNFHLPRSGTKKTAQIVDSL